MVATSHSQAERSCVGVRRREEAAEVLAHTLPYAAFARTRRSPLGSESQPGYFGAHELSILGTCPLLDEWTGG